MMRIQPLMGNRLEQHLRTWADWMRGPDRPDGLPTEASGGVENYSTIDRDSDSSYEKLDFWIAETTNTVIEDIGNRNPAQKAALYRAYDIVSHFRFPRGNYLELLDAAKLAVSVGLRRRGVWLGE
jgi:hypothetical protein